MEISFVLSTSSRPITIFKLKLISQGAGLINHELNELLIMLGEIPQIYIETEIPLVKSPHIPNLA
ncbi:MAG: hypothetical protein ACK47Y_18440, partial [Dolichospermum sp.]